MIESDSRERHEHITCDRQTVSKLIQNQYFVKLVQRQYLCSIQPHHGSGSQLLTSHHGCLSSNPGQSMQDLWLTKCGIVYSLTGYLGLLCQYHSANVPYLSFHPSITYAI